MSTTRRLQQLSASSNFPVKNWNWPDIPAHLYFYDKYSDFTTKIKFGDLDWVISVQGILRKFKFRKQDALLQQRLVFLTQSKFSPSSIYKFTFSLKKNWSLFNEMLQTSPENMLDFWSENVLSVDDAKTGKSILRLLANNSLGQWQPNQLGMIKGLPTRANSYIKKQKKNITNRTKVIPIDGQIDIVTLLDKTARMQDLLEWQVEGLVTLALGFQHAMRPVQLIVLAPSDIEIFSDADGNESCLISFHKAKEKGEAAAIELARSLRPEWIPLIRRLLFFANSGQRNRLFSSCTSQKLWKSTVNVAKHFQVNLDYNYYHLRHSGAQSLADAGHCRKDIKNFLGQSGLSSSTPYIQSSRQQMVFINEALGTSKLYSELTTIATQRYISVEKLGQAEEDEQIAGVVGDRIIAGIGRCMSGQSNCAYDPVISCYGCKKYIPALNPAIHLEAIAGMRQQVLLFLRIDGAKSSTSYLQLMKALASAQAALDGCRV